MRHAATDSPGAADRLACLVAAGLLLAVGVFLRTFRVAEQLLIDDEWHALNRVMAADYAGILSTFGVADHSIPLTLLYEWLAQGPGLDEWLMRLPMMLAGSLLLVVFPWLVRRWLRPVESILLMALLALAPFLVFFSRQARPYALIALLCSACLPLAWHWWRARRPATALAWWLCTAASAWLNPAMLAVTLAPFLPIGLHGVLDGWRRSDWRPLLGAIVLGLAMLAGAAALLAWPLSQDQASLAVKAGVSTPELRTLLEMLTLWTGSGSTPVMLFMVLLGLLGVSVLWRRSASFTAFLLLSLTASVSAIVMTGAAWIHQGLVPARYLVGYLPAVLMLSALGLWRLADGLQRALGGAWFWSPLVCGGVLVALVAYGPMPRWDLWHSQFVNHLVNQYDYDRSRNPYVEVFRDYRVDPVYAEIYAEHPAGDALVVEAPFYLESFWNPLHEHQGVHRQRVAGGFLGGVCSTGGWGEVPAGEEGLRLRNFIAVSELMNTGGVVFLVIRKPDFPDLRNIGLDYGRCLSVFTERFGPPWRQSGERAVFRLPGDGAATTSRSP